MISVFGAVNAGYAGVSESQFRATRDGLADHSVAMLCGTLVQVNES